MTEPIQPTLPRDPEAPGAAPPEVVVTKKNAARLSLVWLVPLLAVLVGAGLLVNALLQAGPRIEISFRTAEGLEPGKTEVRYKEVVVGRVESVTLSQDHKRVIVGVQLERSAANLAVQDTLFWVVRPHIGTAGISGLGTLLSGAYIGADAGRSDNKRTRFTGLEQPPFVLRGEPGRSFVLQAHDLGSLDVGSPVYYRRARVGRVVGHTLDPVHDKLTVQVFIESPYEPLVTKDARFWNASGLNLTFNASGLTLNAQTIASVIAGGIAFEHLPGAAGEPPAAAGSTFYLFANRKAALAPPDGAPLDVHMVFDQSVRGLAAGAPIDFLGIELGSVQSIDPQFDPRRKRFRIDVKARLFPMRLGSAPADMLGREAQLPDADLRFLKLLVEHGVRAQLRTGNLLTGTQYVALEFMPKEPHATLDTSSPVPRLPTVPGTLSELQPQLAEIVAKISKVPFDDIGRDLRGTLKQAQEAIAQLTPQARQALSGVEQTLGAVQKSLDRLDRNVLDQGAPVQHNIEQTMSDLQRAARSMQELGDYLQRHPEAILRGKRPDPTLTPGETRR